MVAGRGRQTLVACKQRSVERFSKGNVDSVIGREVVPQFPNTRQKEIMRVSTHGKVREVDKSRAATLGVDCPACCVSPDNLRNLDIKQVRCVQRLSGIKDPRYGGRCAE